MPLIASAQPGAFEGMLFHLEKPTEYYVESNGVRSGKFIARSRRPADRPAARPRVPLPRLHRPRAAQGGRRRRRGHPRHRRRAARRADDDHAGRQDPAERRRRLPLTRQADGIADRQLHDRGPGLLPHRAHGPARREGRSVAAVHDRRHRRSAAVGALHQAGTRLAGEPGRRALRSRRAPTTTSASSSCSCSTRSTAARRRRSTCSAAAKPLTEISAGHTIYLEELGLKPGDFVSYYAKATDNDGSRRARRPRRATSTSCRSGRSSKDYKPAQSQAGGGGGGGGGAAGRQLSQQQREIVAATFNIVRDKAKMNAGEVPRERRVPQPGAGEAARAGRRARAAS